eukprot:COSAG06_NODE_42232_length_383_cov_1.968310_1_plen_59_part_10
MVHSHDGGGRRHPCDDGRTTESLSVGLLMSYQAGRRCGVVCERVSQCVSIDSHWSEVEN